MALSYPTPTDLTEGDRSLYDELKRRGLYESEVRPQFERAKELVSRPYGDATDEALLEKAHRYLGRTALTEQDPQLRAELVERDLWDKALPRRQKRWNEDEVREAAADYGSRAEFSKGHPAAYYWAVSLDLIDDLFEGELPVPQIGDRKRKWTRERIVAKAQLCQTRSEFHRKFPGAYAAARSLNILDEVCAHMVHGQRRGAPSGMTNAELRQEAAQYDSPNDFLRGNRSAYNQTVRRRIFSQIAEDLGWNRGKSNE